MMLRPHIAHAILHEWTHTKNVMGRYVSIKSVLRILNILTDRISSLDYVYGAQNCLNLAAGSHTVKRPPPKNGPLCPDKNDPTKEGLCDPKVSAENADTIALIGTDEHND